MTTEYRGNTRSQLPVKSAADFESLIEVATILTVLGHKKLTAQQTLFFYAVVHGQAMGHSVTISSIMQKYESLGRSVEKTIVNFLAPTDRFPEALDWITQTEDPDDRRKKYLTLTPKGVRVAAALGSAVRGR